jgi:hypothetical protein
MREKRNIYERETNIYERETVKGTGLINEIAVLRTRIGFNADPDPALYLTAVNTGNS